MVLGVEKKNLLFSRCETTPADELLRATGTEKGPITKSWTIYRVEEVKKKNVPSRIELK